MRASVAVLMAGALLALACALAAETRYRRAVARAPEPARHGAHSERLEELMQNIERVYDARLPVALDPRQEQRMRAKELTRVALALADSADQIGQASEGAGLRSAEQTEFLALAAELRRRALALAEAAPTESAEQLREQGAEIAETCRDCHERFRIPLGPEPY